MAAPKKQDVVVEDNAVYVLRSGIPLYVKTADICAMTGKSNQWIGQLVSQGTLSKRSTPHGAMFDVASAIHAYCDMLEGRVKAVEDKAASAAAKEITEAEVSIKKAKAIKSVLEAKELQGKMHRSEDVAALTEDLIYTVRGAFLALPGRLAVEVIQATSAAEAAEIIRAEVYRAMEGIANYKYDPKKYEERVRERNRWDPDERDDADDE